MGLCAGRVQTQVFNATLDTLQTDEKRLVVTAQQSLNRVIGLRQRMVQQLEAAAQQSTQAIETSQRRISDLRSEIEERQFGRSLLGVDDERQFGLQLQRATELSERARRELSAAVNDDQIGQALRKFQQAEKSGEAAKAIADRLNDRRLEGFAVERLNQLTQTQIQSEQQLQKIQEQRAGKAADAAQSQASILDSVKAQAKILIENIPTVGLDQAEIDKRNARRQAALGEILKTSISSDDISLADTLGLTKLAAELQRNPVSLNIEVETTVRSFADRFQAAINNLKISLPFDTAGLQSLLGRELTTADEISKGMTDARDEAGRLALEISKVEQARQRALTGLQGEISELLNLTDTFAANASRTAAGVPLVGGLDPEQFERGLQLVKALRTETQQLATSTDVSRQDVEGLFERLTQLREVQLQSNFGEGGGGFGRDIQVFADVIAKFLQVANLPSVDPAAESRLKQLQAIIDSSGAMATNIESAMLRGATAIENAADRIATRIDAVVNQGRVQGLASGGFARGTDTALAALTPGEVVMNRSASQRWFSDLQRMNAGMQPQFRNNGGAVSMTVGDIHVTEAQNAQATADEIVQRINRRLRVGAAELRR